MVLYLQGYSQHLNQGTNQIERTVLLSAFSKGAYLGTRYSVSEVITPCAFGIRVPGLTKLTRALGAGEGGRRRGKGRGEWSCFKFLISVVLAIPIFSRTDPIHQVYVSATMYYLIFSLSLGNCPMLVPVDLCSSRRSEGMLPPATGLLPPATRSLS